MGMNHVKLVDTLKELPQHVRIVCARRRYSKVMYTQEGVEAHSPTVSNAITPSSYMIDLNRGTNTAFVTPSMNSPVEYTNEAEEQYEPLLQVMTDGRWRSG